MDRWTHGGGMDVGAAGVEGDGRHAAAGGACDGVCGGCRCYDGLIMTLHPVPVTPLPLLLFPLLGCQIDVLCFLQGGLIGGHPLLV
jgi:hypothetical protein